MSETVWRTVPGLAVDTACWGRQLVLFNRLSGDTHLLNRPVDWVLGQMESGPKTLHELIELAARAGIVSRVDDNREMFCGLLEDLEKIDLLESAPAD